MEICGYKNIMQVPRLEKIVLNIGMGEAISNAKAMEAAEADLDSHRRAAPIITRSKKVHRQLQAEAGNAHRP